MLLKDYLLNEGCKFKVLLIGHGTEKSKLINIVMVDINLLNSVELLRFINFNLYKYIQRSNLYVSSSFTEGFPLSLAEALILETPALSSDHNGSRDTR
ncbi:glycosyltransferase [Robertmurraya beringensis]|uniref:Glycosyltransferase n=1 Tax=Robertmurraya beringensis TaxID=641660 RepID=A0ABV6KS13_9BACI